MGIRRLTLTRAIRVARGNDVACREAGDTKSTLIAASWPSYTLLSMVAGSEIVFFKHSIFKKFKNEIKLKNSFSKEDIFVKNSP